MSLVQALLGGDGCGRCGLARAGVVLLLAVSPAWSQESPCDTELLKQAYGPYGYSLHGERCEGIYKQQVGGTVLWLASLTQAFEPYTLTSGSDLVVEWTAPVDRGVRIRAQGIRGDLYYRMDAVRPVGARSFQWHADLLAAQGITREDLGVLGWMRYPVGGTDRDVYVALRLSQRGAVADTGAYDLVVFPTVALREVYLTVAVLGPDGKTQTVITDGRPLGYGYYPAEQPVHIRLRELRNAGIYNVEIGAELVSGSPVTLSQWIYRPGGHEH